MIDMPASLAADTLLLPLGLYDLKFMPPSVDPLKGWNSWNPGDEEPRPAGFYERTTPTSSNTLPPKHSRLDKAIKDDYQSYLKKHEPAYFERDTSFYEDKTGRHAVKVQIGRSGYYRVYIFWYDKNNVRAKVIWYANGGYAC